MMTKTLKFVSYIILFFSLFLTTKAIQNDDPISSIECKVDKDCNEIFFVEDLNFLKLLGFKIICTKGLCLMSIQ
jgi:hypothetical protein